MIFGIVKEEKNIKNKQKKIKKQKITKKKAPTSFHF
jgi:hypothetical protein